MRMSHGHTRWLSVPHKASHTHTHKKTETHPTRLTHTHTTPELHRTPPGKGCREKAMDVHLPVNRGHEERNRGKDNGGGGGWRNGGGSEAVIAPAQQEAMCQCEGQGGKVKEGRRRID